eukprot:375797_1
MCSHVKQTPLIYMSAPCPQPIITCSIENPLEAKTSECPVCCSRNKLDDNVRKVIFDPKFSDVVFLVGDSRKEFPVIRGYFAPHSTYFANLLFNEESIKSKQIIEKDVSVTAFEFIHKYCYRLYPDITVDNVVEVLFAAQKYALTSLITDCKAYIDSKINNNNINEILFIQQKAIHFSVNIVIEQFNQWLSVENSKRILKSKGFTSLSKEVVMYLIKHNSFSVNESEIWIACKNWCEFQATTGEQNNWTVLMNDFTPHIRFTLMKQEFFAQNVYPTNVLTSQQFAQISLYFMNPTVAKIDFITTCAPRINIYYGAQNDLYRTAQCLQYTLTGAHNTSYECKDMDEGRLLNNYQRITNNDVNDFVVTYTPYTDEVNNQFRIMEAQFAGKVHIVRMDIGGPGEKMVGRMQWNVQRINGRKFEYKGDDGKWIDWKSFDDLKQNEIRTVDVDIQTTAMRILDTTKGHIAVGCWRFYGH